jgi:hypothetical protein
MEFWVVAKAAKDIAFSHEPCLTAGNESLRNSPNRGRAIAGTLNVTLSHRQTRFCEGRLGSGHHPTGSVLETHHETAMSQH